MDQRKISKESCAPALTSSPLTSTASEENCAGRGDVNVRKFRYLPSKIRTFKPPLLLLFFSFPFLSATDFRHLCRSNALTVPSKEALTMTKPLEVKVTLVTLLVCSVKVTKQSPLLVFHTFT